MILPIILLMAATACLANPLPEVLTKRATQPIAARIDDLGASSDPDFPHMYRDGGGGGRLNNCNVMVFADTMITSGSPSDPIKWFVTNSFGYTGFKNPGNPTIMSDFGLLGNNFQAVGFAADENNGHGIDGNRIAIWPNSNMAVLPGGNSGLAVYPVLDVKANGDATTMYNTLVRIDVNDPFKGPVATRELDKLYLAPTVMYGSFSTALGIDGYLYLFGVAGKGIGVARVPANDRLNRLNYKYWTGSDWTGFIPDPNDSRTHLFEFDGPFNTAPSAGDIYFSNHHNTWVCIFMDGFVDGVFRISYALDGNNLTGRWSAPVDLWDSNTSGVSQANKDSWSYSPHAHHAYDPTGRTVLLSYSRGAAYVAMALVTWQ